MDNAAKFSPPDTPIQVTTRIDDGGGATIEVIDQGPGIPLERRDDVFDKYPNWRPDGYEQEAGSGLGLFLVRGIVAGHDGRGAHRRRPRWGYDAPRPDPPMWRASWTTDRAP